MLTLPSATLLLHLIVTPARAGESHPPVPNAHQLTPAGRGVSASLQPSPERLDRRHSATVRPNSATNHWVEGAAVGGILTGLFAGAMVNGLCRSSDSGNTNCSGATLGGFAMGALVGGTVGALIGGAFPKH